MADIKALIDGVLAAAQTAATLIPGTTDDNVVAAGRTLADLVESLTSSAPDTRTEAEMQATRRQLAAAVSAKAERTADRFDG